MKHLMIIAAVAALAGCAGPNPDSTRIQGSDKRQEPSNVTPGLHIGGQADFGVKVTL